MEADDPDGPGKYDHMCTMVRTITDASACIVIVVDGVRGSGSTMQAHEGVRTDVLADMLDSMARQLRAKPQGHVQ